MRQKVTVDTVVCLCWERLTKLRVVPRPGRLGAGGAGGCPCLQASCWKLVAKLAGVDGGWRELTGLAI
jgi:hypothetical protein